MGSDKGLRHEVNKDQERSLWEALGEGHSSESKTQCEGSKVRTVLVSSK